VKAQREISGLLESWRELSQAEGAAIRSASWGTVKELQAAKMELRTSLNEALKLLERETANNPSAAREKELIRAEAKKLISLEARNQDLLAEQRRRAATAKAELEKSRVNLKKVRQSYVGSRREAALQWYS